MATNTTPTNTTPANTTPANTTRYTTRSGSTSVRLGLLSGLVGTLLDAPFSSCHAPFSGELQVGVGMPIPPGLGGSRWTQLAFVMVLNQQQDFLQDFAIVAKAFFCDPVVRDSLPCTVRTTGGACEVRRNWIEGG